MLNWNYYKPVFDFDGSWRDIYVQKTKVADWQKLLEFLEASPYQCSYILEGERASAPQSAVEIFEINLALTSRPILMVQVGSISLNCHFFTDEEIEFDIDPREVTSEIEAEQIFGFMRQIGHLLGKNVILTPENAPQHIIFKFSFGSDELEYFPPKF